jgi:predicted alpha/beta hydrolase family esterase
MRASEADILIIPGLGGSSEDHWQSRWTANLSTARSVSQSDWDRPQLEAWASRITTEALMSASPVVLVAHSLGVLAAVHAAPALKGKVIGGFLVSPPSEKIIREMAQIDPAFLPVPTEPLPFPSVVVASRDDPYVDFAEAEDMAASWGSVISDAGNSGHINIESGHGPWPEGLMRFAGFLKNL